MPGLLLCGLAMTSVAALNCWGLDFAISSALATVGGTSLLACFYTLDWRPGAGEDALQVGADRAWRVAGVVAVLLAVVFGRGVGAG